MKTKNYIILSLVLLITIIGLIYFLTLKGEKYTLEVTPEEKIVFSENFDELSLTENWEVIGNWEIIQSEEAYSPPNLLRSDGGIIFSLPGENWKDYSVKIKGRLIKKEWGYGLIFRAQKTETFYKFYSCQYDPGAGGIVLNKEINGKEITLQAVEFDTGTEWHTLKVEVRGNEFKCYVDDNLVITATDDELTQGKIGIETWGTEAYFDDVIVKLL